MEERIQETLRNLLMGENYDEVIEDGDELDGLRVRSFEEDGVMTYNKGLAVTLPDGSEYQLTIVQSR